MSNLKSETARNLRAFGHKVVHEGVIAQDDEHLSWREKSAKVRHGLNMPKDSHPWVGTHKLTGVPLSARQIDLVEVAWWAWKEQTRHDVGFKVSQVPRWFVDVSQSIERMPWGIRPGTVTQWSRIYAFHLDKVLDGEDGCSAVVRVDSP